MASLTNESGREGIEVERQDVATGHAVADRNDPSIGGFVLVVRDITRRRQSELETAEWKHRYDLLALAAGNVVYDCQSSGVVIWGGGFEQMFGFESEQMQGGFEQWLERIHPDHRDFVQKRFAEAEAKGSLFKAEYRYLSRDGSYVQIEDTGYPYFDDSGKVERFIGVLVDITARKKADEENAKLAESLRHAQKMESIGRLAGGVAHDFNNLLTVISGNVSLAIMELQPNDPLCESMSEVIKAVDSAANLTRQLLAFSRKQVIDPKVLNLNAVVEHLQNLLRRLLGEDIELRAKLAESLGQVRQGYKVYAFPNGGEALMAISEISEYVHLLITDVVMPGVNGRVLAQNLRALRPTLKVLYTSGYTGDVIVHHGVLDKGIEFIPKPYSLEQLAKRVREVLDKPEPQTP